MESNRFRSCIAGIISGAIFGTFFYFLPIRYLLTGQASIGGLFAPSELNATIVAEAIKTGGLVGVIIGFLGGLGSSFDLPRGRMSAGISYASFCVCTVIAYINYGDNLADMEMWQIRIVACYIVFGFFLSITLGHIFSFIELLRD